MTKLHVTHLQETIKKHFTGKIDLTDLSHKNQIDIDNAFLSRGLAAYALFVLALADEENATKSIVDTYNDNGIDAIYFDKSNKLLWLLQSKWIKGGIGSPELGDIKKFRDGIRDLIELNFDKFNTKIQDPRLKKDIEDAVSDYEVRLRIVIAFTGDKLSVHAQKDMDELINELNDPSELAKLITFNLADAHKAIVGSTDGGPIDIDITLANWGSIDEPIQAFYGTISTADISQWWLAYHRRLFTENIRSFIGANDVNNSIQDTLKKNPEHFWYFNNGITLLCKSIGKAAIGGADRSYGVFHCTGVSIVNGAQTVGNIGEVTENEGTVGTARVMVRIISLSGSPDRFGQQITKAANTQNRIEKRDFVTQNSHQERLALELNLLEHPIKYHYIRSDEVIEKDDSNCGLEEATIALACSNSDVGLCVQVKRELGKFWDDIEDSSKPYNVIFNDKTTGTILWRTIRVMREITNTLKNHENEFTGRKRSLYIHGNRFLLHMFFSLNPQILEFNESDFSKLIEQNAIIINNLIAGIWTIIERDYSESLVHQIFRNYTKTRDIKDKLVASIKHDSAV